MVAQQVRSQRHGNSDRAAPKATVSGRGGASCRRLVQRDILAFHHRICTFGSGMAPALASSLWATLALLAHSLRCAGDTDTANRSDALCISFSGIAGSCQFGTAQRAGARFLR